MLGITMQLDISAMLTPQVTTIILHYVKKVLLKKEKERKYKNMGIRPKPTCLYLFIKNFKNKLDESLLYQ